MEYSSQILFYLARQAAMTSYGQMAYSNAAVIMSAVALEAYFNELCHIVFTSETTNGATKGAFESVLSELSKNQVSLSVRINMAAFILQPGKFKKDDSIYEAFVQLFRLRNLRVHRHPEVFSKSATDSKIQRLSEYFQNTGIIEKLDSTKALYTLTFFLNSPPVSFWAFNSALNMSWRLHALFSDLIGNGWTMQMKPLHERLDFQLLAP